MAFAVAIPAWVGWTAAAVTEAAGVYGAVQTRNAGIEQSNEIKMQQRTEATAARQREIDRRQNLMRALSAQNAAAGASGVETSGSVGAGIRRNIKENTNDLLVADANTASRQAALGRAASNATRQGNAGAVTSLLDTAGKTMNVLS